MEEERPIYLLMLNKRGECSLERGGAAQMEQGPADDDYKEGSWEV